MFYCLREAQTVIESWRRHYNPSSQRTSRYVVEGKRFCWSGSDTAGCLGLLLGAQSEGLGGRPFELRPSEEPWSIVERVQRVDLTSFCGDPERPRRYADQRRGLTEIEPGFDAVLRRSIHGDPVARPQRGYPLPGPSVTVAGLDAIAIEDAGDDVVLGDQGRACARPRRCRPTCCCAARADVAAAGARYARRPSSG